MFSIFYVALLGSVSGRTVPVQPFDVAWNTGNHYAPLKIHPDDFVEFHLSVSAHNVYIGKKTSSATEGIVNSCNVAQIQSAFTQISTDPVTACELPLCSFVSGPASCTSARPGAALASCTTPSGVTSNNYRLRYQFTEPGTFYAVCTQFPQNGVSVHCQEGMHVEITVTALDSQAPRTPALICLQLPTGGWGSARYNDMTIREGEKVQFVLNNRVHDLQIKDVTNIPDESGDCPTDLTTSHTLVAVDSTATLDASITFDWLANVTGTFLFWCSQGGSSHAHCNTDGMHFRVTVEPGPPHGN